MGDLVSSPWFGALIVGGTALLVVLLHLLRPRPLIRRVASTLIWRQVAGQRRGRLRHWRWWLSILLSLAISLPLAGLLARPAMRGLGLVERRVVVIVDNSPSMAAKTADGRSRWLHAVALASRIVRDARSPTLILDSGGTVTATGFVSPTVALATLDGLAVGHALPTRLPPLPSGEGVVIHVVSDGVTPFEMPPEAVVHSVFEPADNVAVTRLVVRPLPADPLRLDAFVQVVNGSRRERPVRVTLRGAGGFRTTQTLQMAPGEVVEATFDLSGAAPGALAAAAFTPGDALAGDDIAFAQVAAHATTRVQVVSPRPSVVTDALEALPGVAVETVPPGRYGRAGPADAIVFDGFTPDSPPPAPALLLRPEAVDWLPAPAGVVRDVPLAGAATAGTWAARVPWAEVRVDRAIAWNAGGDAVSADLVTGGRAVAVSGRARRPWIALGFGPADSDLALQPVLPVMVGAALDRLRARDVLLDTPLGTVRIPEAGATVTDGGGASVPARGAPGATLFEAARPDLYVAETAGTRYVVAAGLQDPGRAAINDSRFAPARVDAPAAVRGIVLEGWMFVVAFAASLMALEWLAHARRLTR